MVKQEKAVHSVAIASLSRGVIGEDFVRHEVELGLRRLAELGLTVHFTPHALRGLAYIREHPKDRAADLLEALRDPKTDMILSAIGGDDTYRLLPYLFENGELQSAACDKIFLGFSDTTVNHMMLHKVGMKTFYGQAFLCDVCEMGADMPAYSRRYLTELITTGTIRKITPNEQWFEGRVDFSPEAMGTPLPAHDDCGFVLLQGAHRFSGKILGGCLDTLHDFFNGDRYADMPLLVQKYGLFPSAEDWKGKILLLETSEEKMSAEKFRRSLLYLKEAGVFDAVNGVLFGKPYDRCNEEVYRQLLREVIDNPDLPILANIPVGHAQPRCIVPFGVDATADADEQCITFAR